MINLRVAFVDGSCVEDRIACEAHGERHAGKTEAPFPRVGRTDLHDESRGVREDNVGNGAPVRRKDDTSFFELGLEGRRVLQVHSLCIRQAKLVREILEPDLKLVAVAVDGTTPATAFAGGIQQDRAGIFGGVGAPVPVI